MWCFHDRLKQFTFTDGALIKCCVDCTNFDNKRLEVLLAVKPLELKRSDKIHWQFVLEEAGLSDQLTGNHLVDYAGSLQDLAKLPTKQYYLPEYLEDSFVAVLPTLKRLYDQRRIDAAKRYTMLDDKEHVDRAKQFPHTLTMPRALKNFCTTCKVYHAIDQEETCAPPIANAVKKTEYPDNRRKVNGKMWWPNNG